MASNSFDNGVNQSIADYIETMSLDTEGTLKSIDLTLKAIARQDGLIISQSSLKDLADVERQRSEREQRQQNSRDARADRGRQAYNDRQNGRQGSRRSSNDDFISWDKRSGKAKAGSMFDRLTDDFEDAFKEALFGSSRPFQDAIERSLDAFAKSFDESLQVKDLGKELGKRSAAAFKNLDIAKMFFPGSEHFDFFTKSGKKFSSNLGEQWAAETKYMQETAGKFVNFGLDKVSRALGGAGVDLDAGFGGEIIENLFKEDRSHEAPQVRDIEDIVNSAADKIVSGGMGKNGSSGLQDIIDTASDVIDADVIDGKAVGAADIVSDIVESSSTELSTFVEGFGGELGGLKGILGDVGKIAGGIPEIGEVGELAGGLAEGLPAIAEGLPAIGELLPMIGGAGGELMARLGSLGMVAEDACPPLLALHAAVLAGTVMVELLSDAMKDAINGFKSLVAGVSSAANRQTTQNTKYLELQKQRNEADIKSIKEAAFKVIEDSANKVEEVWDNILTTVSATQGYDKAGVQELWSTYADRLKKEGLASVISSADIMDRLQSVLQQGLSGAVAEEFAYQATLLNSMVPTEDFFQYADTYASLAANAMKNGASQEDAIQAANDELSAFANNLLYASRQIAGGFSTSLQGSADLFKQAAEIALTSRFGDVSDISGVLTSVSAIVGATAPDMVDNIVGAIVSAATGGNSSEITALRSLAGVGASNTAFLRAFATDPQKIFESLFRNLSQMQNMSAANYMEVAEALSSTFGLDMKAFARVDFAYLADAVAAMDLNSGALQQNLELLVDGQTTSTESQLRMQKINEYMIDQGLAYVLDNEVARSIQEHMWQEQLAREIEESLFAVELQGSALDFLNGIKTTITKIGDLLTPSGWLKKAGNVALTALESSAQAADLAEILQLGRVGGTGAGQAIEFYNLTTKGQDLNLAKSYVSLLGGFSLASTAEQLINLNNIFNSGNLRSAASDAYSGLVGQAASATSGLIGKAASAAVSALTGRSSSSSYYTRAIVSKSMNTALNSGDWRTGAGYNALWDNLEQSRTDTSGPKTADDANKLSESINASIAAYLVKADESTKAINLVKASIDKNSAELDVSKINTLSRANDAGDILHRTYYSEQELEAEVVKQQSATDASVGFDEWLRQYEATLPSGSSNLSAILADYGTDIEAIRQIYEDQETSKASAEAKAREMHEVQFWEDMQQFATIDFPWYMREWERYYIQHEAYTNASNEAYKAAVDLKDLEKQETGDSVLALATALTENTNWQQENMDIIKDPVLHTNALLSKILLVVEAIMQQNNETSIVSVPTSLSSLGLGISN